MKRAVRWYTPFRDAADNIIRQSRCGRYMVCSRRMSSGRNGYFNTRAYQALRIHAASNKPTQIGRFYAETLKEALDRCELDANPNWEG